jgi:hypothetical protein
MICLPEKSYVIRRNLYDWFGSRLEIIPWFIDWLYCWLSVIHDVFGETNRYWIWISVVIFSLIVQNNSIALLSSWLISIISCFDPKSGINDDGRFDFSIKKKEDEFIDLFVCLYLI